jgi:hypothetical protein
MLQLVARAMRERSDGQLLNDCGIERQATELLQLVILPMFLSQLDYVLKYVNVFEPT